MLQDSEDLEEIKTLISSSDIPKKKSDVTTSLKTYADVTLLSLSLRMHMLLHISGI
ncbi:hypothetical protein DPMN_083849 [Dreissena polymorpha]|uniref:Uncharacterized protein n=1 Tax=Dreissena polymorpha TaxID=45954 RepID=A0A9D4BIU9_DREPO|nr:hypothetical protein DPMN_083849 [Dreissena polymorpha]